LNSYPNNDETWLESGDVVELSIDMLGSLRNTIVKIES